MVESTIKQPMARRQVNKLTGVGINLWLTSNAVDDLYRLRMGRRKYILESKKSRQHHRQRDTN